MLASIDRSPESARLVLIGSNAFASDTALELASQGMGSLYDKPIEFLQNIVDWTLEDPSLLAIRSRAQFARTLVPMDQIQQTVVEYVNYGLLMLGLWIVWMGRNFLRRQTESQHKALLTEV